MMTEGQFITSDNLKLFTKSWKVEEPKANILFVHGFFEHCDRYNAEALYFNKLGYNFYSYDHRTHGRSEGEPRSFVRNFDDYLNDFKHFLKLHDLKDKPTFLFGHSVGGLVLASYILDNKKEMPNFRGVLFSSPFLMPDKDLAPLLQKMSKVIGTLFPKLKTIKTDSSAISRDPNEVNKYDNDPLIYRGGLYAASGKNLIKQIKKVSSRFSEIDIPFIIQHGTDDQIAEIEGSKKLIHDCSSTDSTLIQLKDFKHEITRDIGFESVMAAYAKWMEDRL